MKKRLIYFLLAIFIFLISGIIFYKKKFTAHTEEISYTIQPETANIFIPEKFKDIGSIKQNVPFTVSFSIHNTGKNDFIIENVQPDCNCTVSQFSTNPIKSKDSTIIELTFNAYNLGPFQTSAFVMHNANNSPTLLIFRGIVE